MAFVSQLQFDPWSTEKDSHWRIRRARIVFPQTGRKAELRFAQSQQGNHQKPQADPIFLAGWRHSGLQP
jgi:hypothetical protein